MKYGEKQIADFDIVKDLEIWPNSHNRNYLVNIVLPEFTCLCPRSGYPDFATISIEYIPDKYILELKALKLYINSFRHKHIGHEDSVNIIYETLFNRVNPRSLKITGKFMPRGNVSTEVIVDSSKMAK